MEGSHEEEHFANKAAERWDSSQGGETDHEDEGEDGLFFPKVEVAPEILVSIILACLPSHDAKDEEQQALRSLDLFLALFPRGRLIVHLPAPSSPDAQSSMRRELRRYAHSRPDRAMLTSGGDFRNLTDVAVRLSTLLEEPYVAASASMHGEEGRVSSSRHQRKRHGARGGGASSTAATDLLRSRIHQFQSALKKGRARRERAAGG